MNLEELKMLCTYILSVAKAPLPSQLKYELIFCEEVSSRIDKQFSLEDIYGMEDNDWVSYEDEVAEYAAVIKKLLADLNLIDMLGMA